MFGQIIVMSINLDWNYQWFIYVFWLFALLQDVDIYDYYFCEGKKCWVQIV